MQYDTNPNEEASLEVSLDHLYKIILVGDMGVGKSCLISKYVRGVFPTTPLPTIAVEFAVKVIQLKEGGYIKSQIWDTAGQEKYKSITSQKSAGALLVYDVTKRSSFFNTIKWLNEIRQNTDSHCVVMLIGNKIDLVERNNKKREVSYEEGKQLAEEYQLLFEETSALSNYNVNDCFEDLLQEIYNEKRKVSRIINKKNNHTIVLGNTNNKHTNIVKGCC